MEAETPRRRRVPLGFQKRDLIPRTPILVPEQKVRLMNGSSRLACDLSSSGKDPVIKASIGKSQRMNEADQTVTIRGDRAMDAIIMSGSVMNDQSTMEGPSNSLSMIECASTTSDSCASITCTIQSASFLTAASPEEGTLPEDKATIPKRWLSTCIIS